MEQRYQYFDQLRGIAILPVMIHHFYATAMPGGGIGVSVFFVLSGYFIFKTGTAKIDDRLNAFSFLIRRIFRIYPLFLFAGAAILYLTLIISDASEFQTVKSGLISRLLLGSGTTWTGYSLGVMWTLVVEIWFYLLFFLLLVFAKNKSSLLRTLFLLFILNIALVVLGISGYHKIETFLPDRVLQYMPQLLLGSLIAGFTERIRSDRNPPAWIQYLPLFLLGGLYFFTPREISQNAYLGFTYLGAAITAILILLFHFGTPQLKIPLLSRVGMISYSLYLIHAIVIDYVIYQFPTFRYGAFFGFLIYIIVCMTAASVTYYGIEQPWIWRSQRILLKLRGKIGST